MAALDYPDPYLVRPFTRPVTGTVTLPGSKSLTNRALALAALTRQTVTLTGALFSDDTRYMAQCLRELGLEVAENADKREITLTGAGGHWPEAQAELYVGNAGTAARFLTALLALRPGGTYRLDGSEAMRGRPMQGLLDALERIGAATFTFHGKAGHFPFTMQTQGLPGGELKVDARASSQILSALLQIAPLAQAPLTLELQGETVSRPFVEMTLALLRQFGVSAECDPQTGTYRFTPQACQCPWASFPIEPDATAASYFIALPRVTGGNVFLPGFGRIMLQGDRNFVEVMTALGLQRRYHGTTTEVVYPHRLEPALDVDFNAISDTFLTLAALTPLLKGPTRISGIAHTRHQETDRIHAMATELRRLGQQVQETEDSMTVTPDLERLRALCCEGPIVLETYEDHRVAMSFGILGCHDLMGNGKPWLALKDPGCCAKTFPDFFQVLERLRQES